MLITDLIFLFLFLPVSLIVFYLCPGRFRNYVLLLISLIFYSCGSADYFLLLILSMAVNICIGYGISSQRERPWTGKLLLAAGIFYNLAVLGYYKYTDFALQTVGRLMGTQPELKNQALPLGLSFFTFKAISYLADSYSGRIHAEKNPVHAALYLSFFAQIQSGPLSRYEHMQKKTADCEKGTAGQRFASGFDGFSEGVYRFVIGFNKKILLANILAGVVNEVFAATADQVTVLYAWTGMICYSLQLFFDFAGYSDMAIGISRMFGFDCPENFHYPYMTTSIAQFWRRWHMTLGGWFRDYVYIPLGGSRVKSKVLLYRNLFAVWILTGIWHGADWTFIFWGLGYFIAIAFEKATGLPERIRSEAGRLAYRIFALLFINLQWVFFRSESLNAGLLYIRNLFLGGKDAVVDTRALFLIKDNLFFILMAILLCFPVMPWLEKKLCRGKGGQLVWNVALIAVNAVLFAWAVSYVVAGQNNPFAYAFF